jgi:hypothetical protein
LDVGAQPLAAGGRVLKHTMTRSNPTVRRIEGVGDVRRDVWARAVSTLLEHDGEFGAGRILANHEETRSVR